MPMYNMHWVHPHTQTCNSNEHQKVMQTTEQQHNVEQQTILNPTSN